ncbi:hypothetical protein FKM82_024010 [Ascaphus truei]
MGEFEVDGQVEHIEVLMELYEVLFARGPNQEDVIDVAKVCKGFQVTGGKKVTFQFCAEQIGILWRHSSAHSGHGCLEVCVIYKCEVVMGKIYSMYLVTVSVSGSCCPRKYMQAEIPSLWGMFV